MSDKQIKILLSQGLRDVYKRQTAEWERRNEGISDLLRNLRESKEDEAHRNVNSNDGRLDSALKEYILKQVSKNYPLVHVKTVCKDYVIQYQLRTLEITKLGDDLLPPDTERDQGNSESNIIVSFASLSAPVTQITLTA